MLLSGVAVFCWGCPSGMQRPRQPETPAAEAACVETTADEITGTDATDGCAQQIAAAPGPDSIELSEGCDVYTCYFTAGTRNRKALEHIRDIIRGAGGPLIEEYDPSVSPAYIDGERALLLDSVSSLEWPETEPWPTVRSLYLAWWEQQLERQWIVYMAKRDPASLCDCSETDWVLERCAVILANGGVDREAVRFLKKEIAAMEYAEMAARDNVVRDSRFYKMLLAIYSSIDQSVDREDPRELLFTTLSNHINAKIHKRLGKNGDVDFFVYKDDFLRLFDSVRVETFEP